MISTLEDISAPATRLKLYSEAVVPLEHGFFLIQVYHELKTAEECIAVSCFDGVESYQADASRPRSLPFRSGSAPFVRVHSECFTGEALGSLKCDCKYQLDAALAKIHALGQGVVVYLRQEGRGIGLADKIKAYSLQSQGYDTLEANSMLGYPDDMRSFALAADILYHHLGLRRLQLNTNNPEKIKELKHYGLVIEEVVPSLGPVLPENKSYLATKFEKLGHHLESLFPHKR
ncbi:MAG: GTP cyclohydrolase II RibA [Zetaproteobacteria bacterium]|nr:GTP cyclohydrolase II RibA [Zetaproteobacteria bacterium]